MSTPSGASGNKPLPEINRGLVPGRARRPIRSIGGGPIRASFCARISGEDDSPFTESFFANQARLIPRTAIPPGRLDRVDVIDLPFHSKRPLARLLRNASRLARESPAVDGSLLRLRSSHRALDVRPAYEAAFIEQFWCAPYVEQVRPSAKRVILDLYNVESEWHRSMACLRDSGLLAWSHARFAQAALDLERMLAAPISIAF